MKKVLVLYNSKPAFPSVMPAGLPKTCSVTLPAWLISTKIPFPRYALIIYGAGVYAGQILGIGKIKRWMEALPEKTWVVFATGATPSKEKYEDLIFQSNFRKGEVRPAHFYYLIAGINYEKMGLFNRLLMKFFSIMDSRKSGNSRVARQTSVDLSNRVYIEELQRYVRLKAR